MTHTVLRGHPTKSQLYLDTILDEIGKEKICGEKFKKRDQANLAEIIYYCMKQDPDAIYMINGSTGEHITYGEILKYSVPLAQAIRAKHKYGRFIMFLLRNHQHMASLYYAAIFAGVIPLLIDPNSTVCEIRHFLELVRPYMVFCDDDRYDDVIIAAKQTNDSSDLSVVGANDDNLLKEFSGSYWSNVDNFQISEISSESTVLLIPTSGSSGLPKATLLSNNGLIAQLPIIWSHHTCFPRPTERALLLSSAQWMTHTIQMISCPVFRVTLVMMSQKPTTDFVLQIMETFRPTWSLFNPMFLKSLTSAGSSEQFNSLRTVVVTGSPLTQNLFTSIMEKLPVSTHIANGLGMTETHGFITMPAPGSAWNSNGKIMNTLFYKIVDESGTELDVNKKGELYVKSRFCIFKGYYENEKAYRETVTMDGWFKTGDVLCRDECDEVYFIERKKFWFKYFSYHIAPEELERVICTVVDVQECVVGESEKGPAAAVVLRSGHSLKVKELINRAINETLSDHKRLRGGVYFVSSLPRTHSGKIKRKECSQLIQSLTVTVNKTN